MRWIYGIRIEYERKRDFFCDNLFVSSSSGLSLPFRLRFCGEGLTVEGLCL
jgi:hypothetical protein